MRNLVKYIIKLNGIYDILCAISILKIIEIPILDKLHLSMIYPKSDINERLFAFWIFTYGIIRLSNNYDLIAYSYLIEALFFGNEYLNNKTVYFDKTAFVVTSSLLLGILSFYMI
jgi:hypothetical protein